jgi:hypothetical protein
MVRCVLCVRVRVCCVCLVCACVFASVCLRSCVRGARERARAPCLPPLEHAGTLSPLAPHANPHPNHRQRWGAGTSCIATTSSPRRRWRGARARALAPRRCSVGAAAAAAAAARAAPALQPRCCRRHRRRRPPLGRGAGEGCSWQGVGRRRGRNLPLRSRGPGRRPGPRPVASPRPCSSPSLPNLIGPTTSRQVAGPRLEGGAPGGALRARDGRAGAGPLEIWGLGCGDGGVFVWPWSWRRASAGVGTSMHKCAPSFMPSPPLPGRGLLLPPLGTPPPPMMLQRLSNHNAHDSIFIFQFSHPPPPHRRVPTTSTTTRRTGPTPRSRRYRGPSRRPPPGTVRAKWGGGRGALGRGLG